MNAEKADLILRLVEENQIAIEAIQQRNTVIEKLALGYIKRQLAQASPCAPREHEAPAQLRAIKSS